MKISAILFDADGVLTLPEEYFSVVYARSRGIDSEPFEKFFRSDWSDIVLGKRDLKEEIIKNPELWQWDADPGSLIEYWCKVEDVRNEALIAIIRELRQRGVSCYLATEQEKYRAAYMKDVMFRDLFRDHFVTSEMRISKDDPAFYQEIIRRLRIDHPSIDPQEILFFDDSQSKIDAAASTGINAQLYRNVEQIEEMCSAL